MCNKTYMRLKISGAASPRSGFIPCGHCEDCRQAMRNGWCFRLRVELDALCSKGWKIGFFTLTYNNEHLPWLPDAFFKDCDPLKPLPHLMCFSKSDVRRYFVRIKKYLHDKYDCRLVKDKFGCVVKDTRLRYMLCSEFGEHTQRSHYHGIVCFPPDVPEKEMFTLVHKMWTDESNKESLGHVFPRYFDGGFDSHGYKHKPFICSSVKAAAVYASKYCCKDIGWHELANKFDLAKKVPETVAYLDTDGEVCEVLSGRLLKLSDYKPFHYQSKSLGASFLKGLTDSKKLQYLKVGYHFVGDDRLQELPIYLKNKILFNPKYVIDERGKRLVRREVRQFFRDNLEEIWKKKRSVYVEKYSKFLNLDYWKSLNVHPLELRDLKDAFKDLGDLTVDSIVNHHLCYFGLPDEECYRINEPLQWFRRYDESYVDVTNCPLIDSAYHHAMSYLIYVLNMLSAKYEFIIDEQERRDNREIARIHDYWLSQE